MKNFCLVCLILPKNLGVSFLLSLRERRESTKDECGQKTYSSLFMWSGFPYNMAGGCQETARQRLHCFLWSNIGSQGGSLPLHFIHWDRVTKSSPLSRRGESESTPQWDKHHKICRPVIKTSTVQPLAAHVYIPPTWNYLHPLLRHLCLPSSFIHYCIRSKI